MTIPASAIVNVTPAVLSAGGSALELNGLLLTHSTRPPIGSVLEFATLDAVSDYFGPTSDEVAAATKYFSGYNNSAVKPGALLVAQYPSTTVPAYLRGGRVSTLTLNQLKAITGTFAVVVDGVSKPIASVDLSAATSFSNAAALLTTQLNASPIVISYDAIAGAFVVTSGTSGASSTIAFATGTTAAALGLTQAVGAVTSQGAIAGVPGTNMAAIIAQTQNWASFTTLWEPITADGLLFAEWSNSRNNRFLYAAQDSDAAGKTVPDTTSLSALIRGEGLSGIACVYETGTLYSAMALMGFIASLDFTRLNGRATMAFKGQSGMAASVTDQTTATNLDTNGYNYFGAYATANDDFTFFYNGQVSGDFAWIDSYVNQIQLNNALQLAILSLLLSVGSVPYNAAGYSMIEAACADPINGALNFGSIRPGVPLSAAQEAAVNAAAGVRISDVLSQRGWYLQVLPATAQVRAARGSPPVTLWYTDGQSIQKVNLLSILVQ